MVDHQPSICEEKRSCRICYFMGVVEDDVPHGQWESRYNFVQIKPFLFVESVEGGKYFCKIKQHS